MKCCAAGSTQIKSEHDLRAKARSIKNVPVCTGHRVKGREYEGNHFGRRIGYAPVPDHKIHLQADRADL